MIHQDQHGCVQTINHHTRQRLVCENNEVIRTRETELFPTFPLWSQKQAAVLLQTGWKGRTEHPHIYDSEAPSSIYVEKTHVAQTFWIGLKKTQVAEILGLPGENPTSLNFLGLLWRKPISPNLGSAVEAPSCPNFLHLPWDNPISPYFPRLTSRKLKKPIIPEFVFRQPQVAHISSTCLKKI